MALMVTARATEPDWSNTPDPVHTPIFEESSNFFVARHARTSVVKLGIFIDGHIFGLDDGTEYRCLAEVYRGIRLCMLDTEVDHAAFRDRGVSFESRPVYLHREFRVADRVREDSLGVISQDGPVSYLAIDF